MQSHADPLEPQPPDPDLFFLQASEFFMFGGLMVADMLLFGYLAFRFQRADAARLASEESSINNPAAVDPLQMEEQKKSTDAD